MRAKLSWVVLSVRGHGGPERQMIARLVWAKVIKSVTPIVVRLVRLAARWHIPWVLFRDVVIKCICGQVVLSVSPVLDQGFAQKGVPCRPSQIHLVLAVGAYARG